MIWGEQNISYFDNWYFVHFASGFIASKTNFFSPITWLIAHTIFEIWENSEHGITTFQNLGSAKYAGDSKENFIGDTIAAMLGFFIGDLS